MYSTCINKNYRHPSVQTIPVVPKTMVDNENKETKCQHVECRSTCASNHHHSAGRSLVPWDIYGYLRLDFHVVQLCSVKFPNNCKQRRCMEQFCQAYWYLVSNVGLRDKMKSSFTTAMGRFGFSASDSSINVYIYTQKVQFLHETIVDIVNWQGVN